METIKLLEESFLWVKGISETIINEAKEETGAILKIFLATLAVSILGNMLVVKPKISEWGVIAAGEGVIGAGESNSNESRTRI